MIGVAQRWLGGRACYRPAGETINAREYDVAEIAEADAKAFVTEHHYSRTYPAARFRHGLYRRGELVGVSVFSHPCRDQVLTRVFPGPARAAVELGRFVLLDEVPGNGETWFLARCFDLLRAATIRGVVSFSDPVPRTAADGRLVFPGHIGTIYQAHNATYTGRGAAGVLHILPDGRAFSRRALQKIRNLESGWVYAARQLEAAGAAPVPSDVDAVPAWLAASLPRVTRRLRHPGNHRYAWPLDRRQAVALERSAYPKQIDVPREVAA